MDKPNRYHEQFKVHRVIRQIVLTTNHSYEVRSCLWVGFRGFGFYPLQTKDKKTTWVRTSPKSYLFLIMCCRNQRFRVLWFRSTIFVFCSMSIILWPKGNR